MIKKFIAAAIQMVSSNCLEENLEQAEILIAQAVEQRAKLIVLPENFAVFGASLQQQTGKAEALSSQPIRKALSRMARDHNIYLAGGTVPVCDHDIDRRPYAVSFFYNDEGEEIARYNKIHLFDADVDDQKGCYRESDTYRPGKDIICVDTPFGRVGFAVCYDLRFPELFRVLFQNGVDIIVLSSAFTATTGAAHWMPLLRARAIENQCFIIAASQGGMHSGGRETHGGSAVISPWGDIMADVDKGEAVVLAELDMDTLKALRQRMPLAKHQRYFVGENSGAASSKGRP